AGARPRAAPGDLRGPGEPGEPAAPAPHPPPQRRREGEGSIRAGGRTAIAESTASRRVSRLASAFRATPLAAALDACASVFRTAAATRARPLRQSADCGPERLDRRRNRARAVLAARPVGVGVPAQSRKPPTRSYSVAA